MTYLEFKRAAKKHYKTSKCLYENCNDNWQIQENIFYLCGYIIEMMLKYHIFRRINYKTNEDIKKLNRNNLTYRDHISKHNINSLIGILQRYENSTILNDVKSVFANWDVTIRYNGQRKNYTNIEELLKLSQKLIEKFEG
jgi:hypothetical protein